MTFYQKYLELMVRLKLKSHPLLNLTRSTKKVVAAISEATGIKKIIYQQALMKV